MVNDISLNVKAQFEDQAFGLDPYLWINVRRGNTFLELFDPQNFNVKIKTVVGRKGINKFFDLNPLFILEETRYDDQILSSQYNSNIKNYMFAAAR